MLSTICRALCGADIDTADTPPEQLWQPEQARAALGPDPDLSAVRRPAAHFYGAFELAAGSTLLPGERWSPVGYTGDAPPAQPALRDSDLLAMAAEYYLPLCHLRAVLAVESAGRGLLIKETRPARPKILFEAHHFYRLTPLPVSRTRPDLSSRRWNRSLYKGGSAEWDRLRDAADFDLRNALKSASWGLGQVMGFNFAAAGCKSPEQLVLECFTGEPAQLRHMLTFIANNDLMPHLRAGRWASFAKGYNGAGYRANRYDDKLAAAARRCR